MSISDAELAISAASAGASVVRSAYGGSFARYAKSDGDVATQADLDAEEAIVERIRAARPDDAVVGEESGRRGPEDAESTWLVDPLCGTLNFVARTPLMSVNVALRKAGRIRVSAVADPIAGEIFWTEGEGAFVRGDGGDMRSAPSAEVRLVDVNLDGASAAVRLLADAAFTSAFRPRVTSTTLALAWVAAGRRAAYVTEGNVADNVHFAAGIALCQGAGCVVTGVHGQPLHTGAGGLVAAADEESHSRIVEIIRRGTAAHTGGAGR